jgi:hypothetical protein
MKPLARLVQLASEQFDDEGNAPEWAQIVASHADELDPEAEAEAEPITMREGPALNPRAAWPFPDDAYRQKIANAKAGDNPPEAE